MPSAADATRAAKAATYDGVATDVLARRLALPRVVAFDLVGSTLDVAHDLAAHGAPAGTLVLADAQSAGRGRLGRSWQSERGAGIWLTLIERPSATAQSDVLTALPLRIGLRLALALDRFAATPVGLKWPNDLYVGDGKLAGVLVEARWQSESLEWLAIGVGINVRTPSRDVGGGAHAAGLVAGVSRAALLEFIVPAVRAAAAETGPLSDGERSAFAARDVAAGRRCIEPVVGRVRGIAADGALLVERDDGRTDAVRAGSLILQPGENAS